MSIKDWPGGVVSKNQVVPSGPYLNSTASGIWTIDQAASYTKQGIWPTAGNAEPDVASVFSTYLYTGNDSAQTVTNGINFATDGGMLWIKSRTDASDHILFDTVRGPTKRLYPNLTNAEQTPTTNLAFNTDGMSFNNALGNMNGNGTNYASWTFRKAPKFFDIQTWTGDGTSNRAIPHNLDGAVGSYFVKCTSDSTASAWLVWHKDLSSNITNLVLNTNNAQDNVNLFSTTAPDSSNVYLGTAYFDYYNATGRTYVAYLFGHETDASSMVQCGGYTGTGSNGNFVSLGWQPQWVMVKRTDAAGSWEIQDSMRGIVEGKLTMLEANTSATEVNASTANCLSLTATGFNVNGAGGSNNANGGTYVYTAIRAPMMIAPTVGTDVFAIHNQSGSYSSPINVGFPIDLSIMAKRTGQSLNSTVGDRLRGSTKFQSTSKRNEDDTGIDWQFDLQNNFQSTWTNDTISWMWKRAKGYMDCVAYTGNGTAGRTVSHSLGVAPEMIWVKCRSVNGENWAVYHSALGASKHAELNELQPFTSGTTRFAGVEPTSSVFSLGTDNSVNGSGKTYISYLFSSLAGVSKVGSYIGDGTTNGSKVIDCGFTSNARFILIKRSNGTGNWWVWDIVRGIAVGSDPVLGLNLDTAEAQYDWLDPNPSGFKVSNVNVNNNGDTYIFYAIA